MAAPNTQELELIKEFRSRLQDFTLHEDLNSDMELLKWIRARDGDLQGAESMLRKHLQWREEINYDQLPTWELPDKFNGLVTDRFLGFDNDNCPTEMGKWDMKTLIQEGSPDYFLRNRWKFVAEAREMMRGKVTHEGVPVSQVSVISDLNGVSISQTTLPVIRTNSESSRILEANFPETLKLSVIINAPWFFPPFFNIVKRFMSDKTAGKIHVFGKNKEEWMDYLMRTFPTHVLPPEYGGTNSKVSTDS